ncbi:MAG TPA: glycosyltransferase, partial [Chloroflexota bacterium]|nr:glycosyltransferase [Chloroflexota bacterium]
MTGAALPTVSIIIPAYQASAYIRDALESVFAQSYRGFEVIVVNDGSPDTPELECALSPYRDRIVYHRQPNRGPSAARNTGIGLARGEFIAFLDSDDQWLPDFLSSQLAYLQADPSLDLVYADATLVGHVMGPVRTFMGKYPSVGSVTVESLLRGTCIVLTSSVVARRASLVSAGLFDESLCGPEDLELWLRLLHRGGNIAYQERILGLYRLHPLSLTSQHGDYLRSLIEALGKIHREHPLSSALRAIVRARIAAFQAELSLI